MALCSTTRRWPARKTGAATTIRSVTGTKIRATKHPTWQGNSRHTATATEKRDETRYPSRLPSGGIPGRHYRGVIPHSLHAHQFTQHRVGDSHQRAYLPLGGGRGVLPLASVLDRRTPHARYRRPGGKVLPTLRSAVFVIVFAAAPTISVTNKAFVAHQEIGQKPVVRDFGFPVIRRVVAVVH